MARHTCVTVTMMLLLFWGIVLSLLTESNQLYNNENASELITRMDTETNSNRTRGIQDHSDKDFVLGALFPVHSDGKNKTHCNKIRDILGAELVEAMLFTIDHINADPALLPNLTLGYDIRDTCFIESIGLDEAFELATNSQQATQLSQCQADSPSNQSIPLLGLIGAAASRVSIPVASLGRLFEIPQVSYASTSTDLSNQREEKYTFFFRTVVPDDIQARAQISLIRHFKWNYISIVYSDEVYGSRGKEAIVRLTEIHNICTDIIEGIDDTRYKEVAEKLHKSNANIIIVFALDNIAEKFLEAYSEIPNHRQLTWIASDGWAEEEALIKSLNSTMFGTAPATQHNDGFQDYLSNLTVNNNRRNPWFAEFFGAVCTMNSTCNGTEHIQDYLQGFAVPRTIEAVYTFAYALQDYLDDNCDQPVEWNRANYSCKGQKRALNGSTMLEYISNVSFLSTHTQRMVQFNDLGYITSGSIDILNFMSVGDGSSLKKVGQWQDNTNNSSEQLQFSTPVLRSALPTSQCKHCMPGQYLNSALSCCGECFPCTGQFYSNDSLSPNCSKCDDLMWGNNPIGLDKIGSSQCVSIKVELLLQFKSAYVIITAFLSLLGLLSVGIVAVIFGIYWNAPIFKSSGREQMTLLLVGIGLSYILAFIYISPPVLTVCIIQRIGLWFCFSLMFGALMVKIIRVGHIFLHEYKSVKLSRYQQPKYILLFTSLIVIVQMVLVLGSVLVQYPEIKHTISHNQVNNDDYPEIVVFCNRDHLAFAVLSLFYELTLIIVTTIFGIISFKYPKNFNESKHISLCTFALGFIWLVFIPSYFATASLPVLQNVIISFAVIMSASAVLFCNFAPRVLVAFCNNSCYKKDPKPKGKSHGVIKKEMKSSVSTPCLYTASRKANETVCTK